MVEDYWNRISRQRISRRRSLGAFAGTAAAAAFLAACGGSSEPSEDRATLVTKPVDTTSTAKRGGVMKDRTFADVPTFDMYTAINPLNAIAQQAYSSFVQFNPGYLKPTENEVGPGLAESWEWAPDGLSITLKLRPSVKWHNKAPVNGRTLDVEDLAWSWDRFTAKSSGRAGVANSVNPDAPVLGFTATDARTVVIKLKEPIVYALGLFAANSSGGPIVLPKEADTQYDLRSDVIGTGAFMLSRYTPSVGFELKRHPEYWDKDEAMVDVVELPIVAEYAAALSQFKAGNIYSFGSYSNSAGLTPEDLIPVKREDPRVLIYAGDLRIGGGGNASNLNFGWLPEGKSPFLDERVRQAVSMSIDRELFLEAFNNVADFNAQGLPVETRWNTALLASEEGWWLDPRGKDFGPNAKYLTHNLAEAKKLLAAAGYPNGFPAVSNQLTTLERGALPPKQATVTDGMIAESGITVTPRSIDYLREYAPLYRDGQGQFEGWGYASASGGITGGSAIGSLAREHWSKAGVSFRGYSASGKNDKSGDPQIDALIEKGRIERDTDKLKGIVNDLQRQLAKNVYTLLAPGVATTFTVAWPCLANYRVYQAARPNYRLWVDDTKAPFTKA